MLVLDASGRPLTSRLRRLTPRPASPRALAATIREMALELPPFDRVSVGFPGIVVDGVVKTAPNLGTELWSGEPLANLLTTTLGKPVRVCNDADLQGFGVVEGRGVELVLTLGTGLGSALFTDGHLVANLELAHHPFRKRRTYEELVSDRELHLLGRGKWSTRVLRVIEQLAPIWNYRLLHLGGGNARKIRCRLPENVRVFTNADGLRGGIRLWTTAPVQPFAQTGD